MRVADNQGSSPASQSGQRKMVSTQPQRNRGNGLGPTHGGKGSGQNRPAVMRANASGRGPLRHMAQGKPGKYGGPTINFKMPDLSGIGDAIRHSNPIDGLFDRIGNRIKEVTSGRR